MREEWKPIYQAAAAVITEVMEAGERNRAEQSKPTDQWMTYQTGKRLHHSFMHLVACKTHEGTHGHPWSLTKDTCLEDWKHALTGLAIIAARVGGFMDMQVDAGE